MAKWAVSLPSSAPQAELARYLKPGCCGGGGAICDKLQPYSCCLGMCFAFGSCLPPISVLFMAELVERDACLI